MDIVIAIDLGTTHIKAIAFDNNLQIRNSVMEKIEVSSTHHSYQEQSPQRVSELSSLVLQELVDTSRDSIIGLCFSNAMHSLIPVDSNGDPLYNALIWSDLRASEIAGRFHGTKLGNQLYEETGTPLHAMSPLFKIIWFRENESEIFNRTEKFISQKEFVIHSWFHTFKVDYSTASAAGLFNIHSCEWSKTALEIAGIKAEKLSEPVPVRANLNPQRDSNILRDFGLNEEIPVFIGATDGCLAELADAGEQDNTVSLTIGTSSAVRMRVKEPIPDPLGRTFNYFFDEKIYITGAPSNSGGNVFDWILNLLNFNYLDIPNSSFNKIVESALSTILPGSDNLLFIPHIYGERAPVWNSESKGAFIGISHNHTTDHFIKAVVEGVVMNMRLNLELLPISDKNFVKISGGAFAINGLCQLTSDILNFPVVENDNVELSAQGAAVLAFGEMQIPMSYSGRISTYYPDNENSIFYELHFEKFRKVVEVFPID